VGLIAGPAAGAVMAYLLLRYTMKRGEHDSQRRDAQEAALLVMTKEQVKLQAETVAAVGQVSAALIINAQSQNETNFLVRGLVTTLMSRPCLVNEIKVIK
jgi:hypothetical protein